MLRSETAVETMDRESATNNLAENNDESSTILDNYYSVQLFFSKMDPSYLFKLIDISSNGPCILVKQDSTAFRQLKEGDLLNFFH